MTGKEAVGRACKLSKESVVLLEQIDRLKEMQPGILNITGDSVRLCNEVFLLTARENSRATIKASQDVWSSKITMHMKINGVWFWTLFLLEKARKNLDDIPNEIEASQVVWQALMEPVKE